jgi:hypothetical protein
MNYRKNERRREKELAWEKKRAELDAERQRKGALSMYGRIEESDASPDVKDILHRLAEHLGIEHKTPED